MVHQNKIEKLYKVTINRDDHSNIYFTDIMQAINMKQSMKKIRKDGFMYHIFEKHPDHAEWFRLE